MGTLLEIGLSNAIVASVLALLAAAGARLLRRPALAHALWLLVLLKLLTPPLITIPLPWPGEPNSAPPAEPLADALGGAAPQVAFADHALPPWPDALALEAVPAQPEPVAAPFAWQAVVATLWLTTSGLWFAWVVLHVYRFRRLLRLARPAPAELQTLASTIATRLGLSRHPAVWLVPGVVSPMLWAIGRTPRLLFPAELLGRLKGEQQEALLAHELAHWRRRDHWVRLIELAALVLYWWHPVVWWARRELHEAEEQCCDAWAVWSLGGAGHTYALALLETVAFLSNARSALPVAASGVGRVHHLRRRLTMIMRANTPRTLSRLGVAAVLGLALVLPLLPATAQQTTQRPQAPQDTRAQQIEALKAAIRALEAEQQAQHKLVAETKNVESAKARAAVRDLKKLYEMKRAEFQDVEAKYREALAHLAKLEGKPVPGTPVLGGYPPAPAGTQYAPAPAGTQYRSLPKTTAAPVAVPPLPPAKRGDLEQKVDRLLKEVEELRRALRGQTPVRPPQQSSFPQPIVPPAAEAVPAVPPTVPRPPLPAGR